MTELLTLVRTADFQSDISTLELSDNSAGWTLAEDGNIPAVVEDDADSVPEVYNLILRGSSQDDAATKLQAMYQKVRECKWSKNPSQPYQIWLRDRAVTETQARQAVIRHPMRFSLDTPIHDHPMTLDHMGKGTLAFERGHWESPIAIETLRYNIGGVGVLGDTYSGAAVPGDVPARIASMYFTSHDAAKPMTECWWGFKTNADGITLANWKGLWELELGTPRADYDTEVATDSTASPGGGGDTKMRCNFATHADMHTRVNLTPFQIDNTNFEDLRGTYQILARLKVDSDYVCRVRFVYDIANAGTPSGITAKTYNPQVTVSGTSWYFYDMGRVTLPVGGPASASFSAMRQSTLSLQAQLYSGTQNASKYLHMDCFVAIPVTEGFGHLKGGSGVKSSVIIDALGRITSYDYTIAYITGQLDLGGINAQDCVIPTGASKFVIAAQRATSSVLDDAIDIDFKAFPRWKLIRGNA